MLDWLTIIVSVSIGYMLGRLHKPRRWYHVDSGVIALEAYRGRFPKQRSKS